MFLRAEVAAPCIGLALGSCALRGAGLVGGLSVLETLNVHSNRLSGSIPDALRDAEYLRYMDVSDNALVGAVPLVAYRFHIRSGRQPSAAPRASSHRLLILVG